MSSNLNIIQNTAIHINPSPPIRVGVTYWVGRVVISNANNYHCKALNRTTTKESYFDLFWKKTMKYLVIMLTFILLVFVFESKGQSADITFIHYSDTSEIGLDREIGFPIINTENNIIDSILNKNIRRDILFDTLTTPIDCILSNMVFGASSF